MTAMTDTMTDVVGKKLSRTSLVGKWLVEFWSDGKPHSVKDFKLYAEKKNEERWREICSVKGSGNEHAAMSEQAAKNGTESDTESVQENKSEQDIESMQDKIMQENKTVQKNGLSNGSGISDDTLIISENEEIRLTHIRGTVYIATLRGALKIVTRGVYQADWNLADYAAYGSQSICSKKTVRYVLRSTKDVLAWPVSMMDISEKEREMIPKLQRMYLECDKMLRELEDDQGE